MGLAQEDHAQPGLADAAPHGQGQLARQQHPVEGELPAAVAAGQGQLPVQGGRVHPDAHGGDLEGPLQHRVPQQDVPVQRPVVIVGGPAVVGPARLQLAADAHEEGGGVVLHPGVLPLLGGQVGPAVLQLLGGDEGHLGVHQGQGGELRVHRPDGGLGVGHRLDDGAHRLLQKGLVPVPGGDDLLPVPLVHVHRVEIVQLLVPADGVHVGVQPLAHRELIAVQGHALPLGQGVDHLGLPPGEGDVEGDRALHSVQVVVEAAGRLHKQGGGHPAQAQGPPEGVGEQPLEQADGLLGVVQIQTGGVPLGDDGLFHG